MDGASLNQADLHARLKALQEAHEALNEEVDTLNEMGVVDQLKIARLKKEKLRLKDEIQKVSDQITPDIIA